MHASFIPFGCLPIVWSALSIVYSWHESYGTVTTVEGGHHWLFDKLQSFLPSSHPMVENRINLIALVQVLCTSPFWRDDNQRLEVLWVNASLLSFPFTPSRFAGLLSPGETVSSVSLCLFALSQKTSCSLIPQKTPIEQVAQTIQADDVKTLRSPPVKSR